MSSINKQSIYDIHLGSFIASHKWYNSDLEYYTYCESSVWDTDLSGKRIRKAVKIIKLNVDDFIKSIEPQYQFTKFSRKKIEKFFFYLSELFSAKLYQLGFELFQLEYTDTYMVGYTKYHLEVGLKNERFKITQGQLIWDDGNGTESVDNFKPF